MKNDIQKLRDSFWSKEYKSTENAVVDACIGLVEHFLGITPYYEQMEAAAALYRENIVNQNTGEGKTISVLLASMLLLRDGRKVYILTSNDYLAKRDWEYAKPIWDFLGFQSMHVANCVGINDDDYRRNHIFYTTGEALIFDYLRGIKAEYDFAIVDEVDYMLVECAGTSFSVSDKRSETQLPVNIYKMCKEIADLFIPVYKRGNTPIEDYLFDMQYEADVIVEPSSKFVSITERGYRLIDRLLPGYSNDPIFIEAFIATLCTRFVFIKDVDYMVENGTLHLIDRNSGRKSPDSSYGTALQTALEVKEGIAVKSKDIFANTCSYTVFMELFRSFSGISGTAGYVPYDFDVLYGKETIWIKDHQQNQRKEIFRYFVNEEAKKKSLFSILKSTSAPVLIVTQSDRKSKEIFQYLKTEEDSMPQGRILLLDNYSLAEEKKLLKAATEDSTVLISSKIVGRGTDITVMHEEGLTVIIYERFPSERQERQVIGRTGRNGKPGRCYILTSNDDPIYLLDKEKRLAHGEKRIQKIQKQHEIDAFEGRKYTYIINKLFFEQSNAVLKELEEIKSFQEIYHLAQRKYTGCELAFTEHMRKILIADYMEIKPWYQQQFLDYVASMGGYLYSDTLFNELSHNLIHMSREVLFETAKIFLKQMGLK